MPIQLNNDDLDFILRQLLLPNNDPRNGPGTILDPFGIRDVQGIGNNVLNPVWGAADQLFARLTTDISPAMAEGTLNQNFTINSTPTSHAVRNVNLVDSSPRFISNIVSNQSGPSGGVAGHTGALTAAFQPVALSELQVQDNPNTTPGGRLSPLTGNTNPLPFSSYMSFFGQFFDHGLDFVHKGQDGMILIPLQPGDPLYDPASQTNFMVASRSNTINVTIGVGSTDGLVSALGLAESTTYGTVTGGTVGAIPGGALVINGAQINIAAGSTLAAVVDAVNAQSQFSNVVASISAGHLVLTPRSGESINTVSPFIDLSQAYGSAPSHTVFLREYDGNGVTTGRLVSEANGSMPTWATIKLNASYLNLTLHDYNVTDVPLVRLNADGTAYRDANGQAWLVAQEKTTGAIVFVQDTDKAALTAANLVLLTTGHAFLDDMAHNAMSSGLDIHGDLVDPTVLNAHLIGGDGRVNENIALTAIHEVFHSEHNTMLLQIQQMVAQRPDAASWTPEMFFQAAKLVTEMEYQHLVFAEFARKLSPNINAFAAYDVTINPVISAEFANAVYRLGHSMMTDMVAMKGFDAQTGISDGTDKSMPLLQAFLNPTAFSHTVAGEVAIGASQEVGYGIDEWVVGTLRSNLVGLPLDLAALNIARGRDALIPTWNEVRTQLFDQTGMTSLQPYTSWDDVGMHLVHPESLKNFIAAYAANDILTLFAPSKTLAEWNALKVSTTPGDAEAYAAALSAAADAALNDATFMTTNQRFNDIDLWLGGLAEAKVTGGMLGSTFDFIFARQMIELQNADRLYYLNRLAGTNLLAQIDAQLFSDVVMRNTGVTHLYSDIFSVADSYVEMSTATTPHATLFALQRDTVTKLDADGVARVVNQAGYVGSTFYGNLGDYLDARGVLNPNGKGNASETIGGTSGNDIINAGGGNDTVWGDGGNDVIEGGTGNDFLHGGDGNDVITDAGGSDFIWGDAGDDTINAGDGIDQVFGGDGNDVIRGGLGADTLDGGKGDDVIYGDNNATDPMGDADVLVGGDGNDTIYGGGGNDALDGGVGDDILYGGTGTDSYIGWDGNDRIVMDASQFGFTNIIDGGLGYDVVDYSASMGNGVTVNGRKQGVSINLSNAGAVAVPIAVLPPDSFVSVEGVIGSQFDDTLVGGTAVQVDQLGNPILNLNAVPTVDPITGALIYPPLLMQWTIDGGAGNDLIEGGPSDDTLIGGLGIDTVSYAAALAGVTVNLGLATAQNTVGAGIDTLSGIENIIGSAFADTLTGDAGANTFFGVVGADSINGGAGIDTVSLTATSADLNAMTDAQLTNVEVIDASTATAGVTINLANQTEGFTIIGSAFADTITGGSGADTIIGVVGADTINGGAGIDTIRLTATSADLNAMTNARLVNVEAIDASTATAAVTINLANQTDGFTITGSAFADTITGSAGADTIVGVVGADTINGGAGTDTIRLTATSAALNAMTNARLTNVEAVSAATATAAVVISLANQTEGFSITGSAFADTLTGGTGNDTFVGVVGADTMNGGAGTDTILLTATSAGLNALTNAQLTNVEAISAATAAAGVVIAVGAQTEGFAITGSAFADTITGSTGADSILAGLGNDTIVGVVGADTIDGGAGVDTIRLTATSSDLNAMTNARLVNVEAIDASTATAAVVVNLGNQSDGFTVTGSGFADTLTGSTGADTLNGGAGNDTLIGGAGNDILNGGLGNDILTGGAGNDIFRFDTARGPNNIDRITDYNAAADSIQLSAAIFTGLATGAGGQLAASAFALNQATGNAAQIVYNTNTGALFYDSNGAGAGGSTQFALLSNPNGTINRFEFFVV